MGKESVTSEFGVADFALSQMSGDPPLMDEVSGKLIIVNIYRHHFQCTNDTKPLRCLGTNNI